MMMKKAGSPMIEVNWNQLLSIPTIDYSSDSNGITYEDGRNGTWHIYGTATSLSSGPSRYLPIHQSRGYVMNGHTVALYGGSPNVYMGDFGNGTFPGIKTAPSVFLIPGAYTLLGWRVNAGVSVDENKMPLLFDLTQMFGAGNEPTTTAEFEAWLQENGINPNEYIPYNAGEIRQMTKPSWL